MFNTKRNFKVSYTAKIDGGKKDISYARNTFPNEYKWIKDARKKASEFARKEFTTFSNVPEIRFEVSEFGEEVETFKILKTEKI